jgi:hypothetical protein
MNAGLEKLAQGEIGHRHGGGSFRFVRLCLRGALSCDTGPGEPGKALRV